MKHSVNIWDIVMGVSGAVLAVSLIPQLIHNINNNYCDIVLKTSLTTAIPLTATCIGMFASRLYITGLATAATTVMWWILVIQRVMWM